MLHIFYYIIDKIPFEIGTFISLYCFIKVPYAFTSVVQTTIYMIREVLKDALKNIVTIRESNHIEQV